MEMNSFNSEQPLNVDDALQQEIADAHEMALYSEKIGQKLASQALAMKRSNKKSAVAKQTVGHRL